MLCIFEVLVNTRDFRERIIWLLVAREQPCLLNDIRCDDIFEQRGFSCTRRPVDRHEVGDGDISRGAVLREFPSCHQIDGSLLHEG